MSDPQTDSAVTKELQELRSRLSALEQRRRSSQRIWIAAAALVAVGAAGVALASPPCANGLPFCFQANAPAIASELNTDLAQLKTWLEAKTGATGSVGAPSGDITTGRLAASGYAPNYTNYNAFTLGAGQAAVVNDNASYQALMLLGNNSAGGARSIKMYDNVAVSNALTVGTNLTANTASITSNLTVGGFVTTGGFDVSCGGGESGFMYGFCCRMNVRTGATTCKVSTSTTYASWVGGGSPFGVGPDGRYSLSCAGTHTSGNFPMCCRSDQTGATSCVYATSTALSWLAAAPLY